MRASGQKLVKFYTLTHTLTHAAKLVVRIKNTTCYHRIFAMNGQTKVIGYAVRSVLCHFASTLSHFVLRSRTTSPI